MKRVIVAEPIYSAMRPEVYFNRIAFWKHCFNPIFRMDPETNRTTMERLYIVKPMILGPRQSIRNARDLAITAAIDGHATHLFFVDDDVLIRPTIMESLLLADKPVIGVKLYKDDGMPTVYRGIFDGSGQQIGEEPWIDHPKDGPFECSAIGAGCMLIKVEVLTAVRTFFMGQQYLFNYNNSRCSMDVLFCNMVRQCGYTVWCWFDDECMQFKSNS